MDLRLRRLERQVTQEPGNLSIRALLAMAYRRAHFPLEEAISPLIDPLMAMIEECDLFDEIMSIIIRACTGRLYMVGGRIFRGLTELLYGRKAGFEEADWDFLCLGIPYWIHNLPPGWEYYRRFYVGDFSVRFYHRPTKTKIDLISIFDKVPEEGFEYLRQLLASDDPEDLQHVLDIYYDSVPLDVQAISFDLATERIGGEMGLNSIFSQTYHCKHPLAVSDCYDPDEYAENKGEALGFRQVRPRYI